MTARSSSTPRARALPAARLSAAAQARSAGLLAALAQVRRRRWLQRSLGRAVRALSLAGLLWASTLILIRANALPASLDDRVTLGALVLGGLAAVWVVAHRLSLRAAAHLLDRRAAGLDRAATALELADLASASPAWVTLQAEATERWVADVDVPTALPWRAPHGLGTLAVAALSVAVALLLPLAWIAPAGQGGVGHAVAPLLPAAPTSFASAADLLGADALTLLREDVAVLEDITEQVDDTATKKWLQQVTQVLKDVEQGKVDKRTALAELAKLERARPEGGGAAAGDQQAGGTDNPEKSGEKSGEDGPSGGEAGKAGGASGEQQAEKERQIDRAVTNRVADSLKDALKGAPEGKMREALKRAVEKKDLGLMGKMLEKLAEKAQKDMSDKELSKWMKVAEKFANKLGDKKVPKRFAELERRVRRLQAKRKRQGGLGQQDRRRLASTKRQLQQLQKAHGDVQGAKYTLQRLQKEAKKAAQELRRTRQQASRLKRKRGKRAEREQRRRQARSQMQRSLQRQMRRAATEMRRRGSQQRSRQARRIGQRRLRDLRDSLRRSGQRDRARRDFERRARQAKRGQQGEQGRGQQARKGGLHKRKMPKRTSAEEQRRRAAERAARNRAAQRRQGGRRNKVARRFRLGEGDMPDRTRMRMMRRAEGQGEGESGGSKQGPGQGTGVDRAGNQAGDGAGGPYRGKRARIAAARTEQVKGVDGEGPSIKKVFTEAAKKGFARRGWREVYADYSEVAEEMMESEGLPVGRKALVKRYFELIRPR